LPRPAWCGDLGGYGQLKLSAPRSLPFTRGLKSLTYVPSDARDSHLRSRDRVDFVIRV